MDAGAVHVRLMDGVAGDIAAFGSDLGVRQSVSLATRLDWCLGDAKEWIEGEEEEEEEGGSGEGGGGGGERGRKLKRKWILKPSTLNKGAGLALGEDFETLREAIHGSPDIREWVLQVRLRLWSWLCMIAWDLLRVYDNTHKKVFLRYDETLKKVTRLTKNILQ